MKDLVLNKDSQKNKIFNLLIKHPNKTAKQIYYLLKKNSSKNSTYQSIFKSLSELIKENVLIKKNLNYMVNFDWIDDQINYFKNLKKINEYNNNIMDSKEVEIVLFNNLEEVDKFIQSKVLLLSDELNVKETYWKTPHCWWLLGYPLTEEKVVKKYNNKELKCNAVICGNSLFDKKAMKYYNNKKNYSVRLNNNCNNRNEIFQIIGDYIIIFELSNEILNEMDEIYNKVNDDNLQKMLNLIFKKINIKLKIIKDKYLTNYYINKIKGNDTFNKSNN